MGTSSEFGRADRLIIIFLPQINGNVIIIFLMGTLSSSS
jgi:hypothetical protein